MVPPPSEDEVDELEDDDDYDIIPLSKIKEETREEIDELEDGDVHISGEEVRAKNPDLSTVNRVLYSPYEEKKKPLKITPTSLRVPRFRVLGTSMS